MNPTVQLQMLEVAASAIDLIESRVLTPRGEQARLLLPELQTGFTNDLPANERKHEPVNYLD